VKILDIAAILKATDGNIEIAKFILLKQNGDTIGSEVSFNLLFISKQKYKKEIYCNL
jgi:hypothetical protein